ncbi:MAG: thiamine phosphate synthase [Hyphomonadaceae bacterium]|nr:thiamine phosphate synthase [Hyphomonadaceae bacterium]
MGAPPIPSLYFFTDPDRTPNPISVARRLPAGAAIVYRHFGAANRLATARRIMACARARGLKLLVSADPELAAAVGAAGVHWPEKRLPAVIPAGLNTVSAHSWPALLRAADAGASAIILAPIFATRSAAGHAPIGLFRASQWARSVPTPVIALGGIGPNTARRLHGRGFAGLAAVDAFSA